MTDLFGPADAAFAVTTRPEDDRTFGDTDTWLRDCTTDTAEDGTEIRAALINAFLAQLRGVARGNGNTGGGSPVLTESNANNTIILNAIQHLIQRGRPVYATVGGTANAITASLTPAPAELVVGLKMRMKIATTNTDAVTIATNGGSALAAILPSGDAMPPGALRAGMMADFEFDGTAWQLVSGPGASGAADGRRNLLINGDMAINQRVFAGGALANGAYGYDRWKAAAIGTSVTRNASTGVITLAGSVKQIIRIGSGSLWDPWNTLAGQTVTISVDAPSANLTVSIGDGGSNTASGTITSGSGRRGVALVVPSAATGNLHVQITASSSTTFSAVMVERGGVVRPFERPTPALELILCRRAYRKSYNYGAAPGSVHAGDSAWWSHTWFAQMFPVVTTAWQEIGAFQTFDTEMWAVPTVKVWDANGTANKISLYTGAGGGHRDNVAIAYQDHVGASWVGYEASINASPQHVIAWHYSATPGTYGFFFGYECDADL